MDSTKTISQPDQSHPNYSYQSKDLIIITDKSAFLTYSKVNAEQTSVLCIHTKSDVIHGSLYDSEFFLVEKRRVLRALVLIICSKRVVVVKVLEMNDHHMIKVPEEMYLKHFRAKNWF